MRALSIAAALAPAALAAAAPAETPPARIVLLGARWCAPCMAEYRELPALATAAAPERIVLGWIDRPLPLPRGLESRVEIMPPAAARALAVQLGGQGFGLPMATRIVPGRPPCPPHRAALHPRDLPALRAACPAAAEIAATGRIAE